MISSFFARPGVQTSEFKVLTAATAWLGLNGSEHWVSWEHAIIAAVPAIVYALSRGFAKTEQRGGTGAQ